ncbi:hypothetical protein BV22DRAFT_878844 [Leucogyrophana mollusca]|uniref:Uncharacterized protein n=1 Tax=Leucogyrophana mollusca TaxID=85980 RepID=A0ACB8B0A6_9AGAM|nr:hypothetical protein BV22DRAFT_878844 [Leucogyrophana mollusca]
MGIYMTSLSIANDPLPKSSPPRWSTIQYVRPLVQANMSQLTQFTEMYSPKYAISIALAYAAIAFACKYSKEGHTWDMYVYSDTGCQGTHEEFYGTAAYPWCECFELTKKLNDKVKSFTYTAGEHIQIGLFQDAECKGKHLGTLTRSTVHP